MPKNGKKCGVLTKWRKNKLAFLGNRLRYKEKELELKSSLQRSSHSLFWVWEFSKKAVLICFAFYIIVQVYAMIVMVHFGDLTYLGELVSQTGYITRDCVFAYLIKAGLENIGKIWFSRKNGENKQRETDEEILG